MQVRACCLARPANKTDHIACIYPLPQGYVYRFHVRVNGKELLPAISEIVADSDRLSVRVFRVER